MTIQDILFRSPLRHAGTLLVCVLAMGAINAARAASPLIQAVGVENEYADVISQIGGPYVRVTAIETDPNTDPHSFEISPRVAARIADAQLIVENGLGYDDWADRIIAAVPAGNRKIINVQHLLGMPDATPNPHLWYDPKTMPAVADAVATALSALMPEQAKLFVANAAAFKASLKPWDDAIAGLKAAFPGIPVAVTEPVGDYMLQAAGTEILTPFGLQAAIMNGNDPAPQDVTLQNSLFTDHKVKIFVYNQQVTDPLTQSFLALARQNRIPIVGVYETMPEPGYHYQTWMLAEVNALREAVTRGISTETLLKGGG
jgi:zinc/manganese transport system substrate-binding protein